MTRRYPNYCRTVAQAHRTPCQCRPAGPSRMRALGDRDGPGRVSPVNLAAAAMPLKLDTRPSDDRQCSHGPACVTALVTVTRTAAVRRAGPGYRSPRGLHSECAPNSLRPKSPAALGKRNFIASSAGAALARVWAGGHSHFSYRDAGSRRDVSLRLTRSGHRDDFSVHHDGHCRSHSRP